MVPLLIDTLRISLHSLQYVFLEWHFNNFSTTYQRYRRNRAKMLAHRMYTLIMHSGVPLKVGNLITSRRWIYSFRFSWIQFELKILKDVYNNILSRSLFGVSNSIILPHLDWPPALTCSDISVVKLNFSASFDASYLLIYNSRLPQRVGKHNVFLLISCNKFISTSYFIFTWVDIHMLLPNCQFELIKLLLYILSCSSKSKPSFTSFIFSSLLAMVSSNFS